MPSLAADCWKGLLLGLSQSTQHIIHCYVKIPIGIIIMLLILYGVNEIILQIGISFPASVTCMLVLYFFLLIATKIFGRKKTAVLIRYIEIPAGFALRWINIFFTPAFMTLPTSSRIEVGEAFIIAAVFVIGYFITTVIIAYFTILLQRLLKMKRKSNLERAEELNELNEDGTSTAIKELPTGSNETVDPISPSSSIQSYEPPQVDEDELKLEKIQTNLSRVPTNIIIDLPRGDEDQYEVTFRKGLETKSARNSLILNYDDDDESQDRIHNNSFDEVRVEINTKATSGSFKLPKLTKPTAIASPNRPLNPGFGIKLSKAKKILCKRSVIDQEVVIERHVLIGNFIAKHFDLFVFGFLFIAGIPIYFAVPYEMFLQLSISIFSFILMLNFPVRPKFKKYLHPVLFSVGLSLLIYYIFALMKGESFLDTIYNYKTGRSYLYLFNHRTTNEWPGAGDVMSTFLDVSIVALSLPMYTYRHDLYKHMFAMIPPILLMTFGSYFIYPPLCYHIGISAERSLGFAGRSVTLALGTPFVKAIGGSIPLMACTTVVSGIVGALTGQAFFKFLRIRDDDYITRGLTLGVNCGAIATAHLLTIDPRAAAISSLSFVLFGTLMVIFGSITAIAQVIQGWVGL